MRPGRAIFDGLRLAIRLVPDDVGPQKPAIGLKSERDAPRNANQIFGFQTLWRRGSVVHSARWIFFVGISPGPVATGIRIADVQPERTVISQHSFHILKNFPEALDVLVKRRFSADLTWNAVIAEAPVRGTGDTASKSARGEQPERMPGVAHYDTGALPFILEARVRQDSRQSVRFVSIRAHLNPRITAFPRPWRSSPRLTRPSAFSKTTPEPEGPPPGRPWPGPQRSRRAHPAGLRVPPSASHRPSRPRSSGCR